MVIDNLFPDPSQNGSEPPCNPLCLHAVSLCLWDRTGAEEATSRPVHRCNGKQVHADSQTRDKCLAEPEPVQGQVRP